jgi:hypothetical protein
MNEDKYPFPRRPALDYESEVTDLYVGLEDQVDLLRDMYKEIKREMVVFTEGGVGKYKACVQLSSFAQERMSIERTQMSLRHIFPHLYDLE